MLATKPNKSKLRGYWVPVVVIAAASLAIYGIAEALKVPFLTDISSLDSGSWLTAFIVTSLLTADVFLPVPSSALMVANGAFFGFWAGSAISFFGSVAGFLLAYWLGRRSSLLIQGILSPDEVQQGNRLVHRWGVLALIITRPVPILAEATMIMAGVARLPFSVSLGAVMAGLLPVSMLYAWAGSHAKGFNAAAFIFLALLFLAAVIWVHGRRQVSRDC